MNRNQRLAAIQKIIRDQEIENQDALKRALEAAGFEVTQSTISRDLQNLGLNRVRGKSGRMVYSEGVGQVPENRQPELKRIIREFLLEASVSGNILVMRTAPGNAQPLAAAIDRANLPGFLGTLAGDDTIMAVLAADAVGDEIAVWLRETAGLMQAGAMQ